MVYYIEDYIEGTPFAFRKKLTINNNSGGALTDYQVKVTITYANAMQSNFNDLRFVYPDKTNIPYWIESKMDGITATVWIKVNLPNYGTSPTGDNIIYMYYGNPNVTSISNGISTFTHFDNFSYGLLQWTQQKGYGGIANINETVVLTTKRNAYSNLYKLNTTDNLLASIKVKDSEIQAASWGVGIIFYWDTNDWVRTNLTTNQFAFGRMINNSGTETVVGTGVANTYYWLRLRMDTNNVYSDYSLNGTSWINIGSIARPTTWTGAPVAIIIGKGYSDSTYSNTYLANNYSDLSVDVTVTMDDLIVRKYVVTEPTTTIGSAEPTNQFSHRKKLTINNNSGGALTDYQVKVIVTYASGMQSNFDDIRFVYPNKTNIPYWIESKTDGVTTTVWIKVNLPNYGASPTGDNIFYMYYSNPSAISASSGTDTFILFDDFTGASLDTNKWIEYHDQSVQTPGTYTSQAGSILTINPGTVNQHSSSILSVDTTLPRASIVTSKWKSADSGDHPYSIMVFGNGVLDYASNYVHHGIVFYNSYFYYNVYKASAVNNAGTTSYIDYTPSPSGDYANYHIYDIVSQASDVVFSRDGSTTYFSNPGSNILSGTQRIGLSAGKEINGGGNFYIDYIFVRKYALSEPTTTTGSAESINPFSHRKKLTINNNSGGALTDYQVKVTITYANAMQSNFNDLRFVYPDKTNIPYWIESKTDSVTATVWIKVNLPNYGTSPTGDNIIYMYYGNPNVTSASNGINTFDFFDDMSVNTINTNWFAAYKTPSISGGTLGIGGGCQPGWAVKSKALPFNLNGYAFQFKNRMNSYSSCADNHYAGVETSTDYRQWNFYSGTGSPTRIGFDNLTINTNGGGSTSGVWYKIVGKVLSTGTVVEIYDGTNLVLTASSPNNYVTTSHHMFFGYFSAAELDDVILRKYASPEPTTIIGQEEHSRKGGIIIY